MTTLYTGARDGSGQLAQTITNGIDLVNNDGLVWIKCRNLAFDNILSDTKTGDDRYIMSNSTSPAIDNTETVTEFLDNGFNLGSNTAVNDDSKQFVAWTFGKAAGYFDVVKYTGTGSPQTIPHSLGTKPGMMIVKSLTSSRSWAVYHSSLGYQQIIFLETDGAASSNTTTWTSEPTDTEFFVGTNGAVNAQEEFIAYLFAEDTPGVIKCGTHVGTADGVRPGFEPQWVLIKSTDNPKNWYILDKKLPKNKALSPNLPNAEVEFEYTMQDDGFHVRDTKYLVQPFIYVAIAAPPITRTQTAEEFAETQLKMLSYKNRKEVVCGERATAQRDDLIAALVAQGYTLDEVLEFL